MEHSHLAYAAIRLVSARVCPIERFLLHSTPDGVQTVTTGRENDQVVAFEFCAIESHEGPVECSIGMSGSRFPRQEQAGTRSSPGCP